MTGHDGQADVAAELARYLDQLDAETAVDDPEAAELLEALDRRRRERILARYREPAPWTADHIDLAEDVPADLTGHVRPEWQALQERLCPVGAACVITAEHGCMTQRGVMQPETVTTTHALTGRWVAGHPDVAAVLAEHNART